MGALVALSLSFPTDLNEDFISQNYVSKFARTGVEAIHELVTHGYLESDASVAERLKRRRRRPAIRHANSRTLSCCMMNPVSTLRRRPE